MNKELFQKELNKIQKELDIVNKLDVVNQQLQKNNWIFLHPYNQVYDIDILEKLSSQKSNPDEDVLHFFARKFFDLRGTIHFIEGFYLTRPFLKNYVPSIRESVILCLQKDFRGAITVLIPVIEGTLRKYLISKRGEHKKSEIKINELLKSINVLADEYVELQKKYLRERNKEQIERSTYLDINQENKILSKHRLYFDLWMKQFRNFIKNNLYLNTKKYDVSDTFNRHLIFHGFEENVEYTFSNYLRVFNSLNYLSWAIGNVTQECSVLSHVPENKVRTIWADYLNILITSEALTECKNNIYSTHVESFKKYLYPEQIKMIKRPVEGIKIVLQLNDFLKK